MENNEYVSCKKCQCEITEKGAKRYNGYCRNCYKGKEYISNDIKKRKNIEIIGYVFGILILMIIITSIFVIYMSNEKMEKIHLNGLTDEEKGYAIAVAKEEVRNNLKSPSSSDFPSSSDEYTITKDGDIYTVNSYVEADNSFGTKLKINYIVQFTMTGEETYVVNNVIVDE